MVGVGCEQAPGGCSHAFRVVWPFPVERGSAPFLDLYHAPSAFGSVDLKKIPPIPVTRFIAVFVLARLNDEVLRGLTTPSSATAKGSRRLAFVACCVKYVSRQIDGLTVEQVRGVARKYFTQFRRDA